MEALFELREVISVVFFTHVHDEFGQSLRSAAGLLRCCRREEKKHKGRKGKSPRHHLSRPFKELSSGGLRALAHFPIKASQPRLFSLQGAWNTE